MIRLTFLFAVHTIGGDIALVNSVNHEDLSCCCAMFPVRHRLGLWSRTESTPKRQQHRGAACHSSPCQRVESLPQPGKSPAGNVCYRCAARSMHETHDVLPALPSARDGGPSWPESDSLESRRHDTWRAAEAVENTATLEVQLQPETASFLLYRRNYEVFIPGRRCGHRRCPGNRRPYLVSAS